MAEWSLWRDIKNLAVDLWRGITWFRKRPPAEEEKAGHLLEEFGKSLEAELNRETDPERKQDLKDRLEAVRAAQIGYTMKRLERTLERAGFPPFGTLVADGKRVLKPAEEATLNKAIAYLDRLPRPPRADEFIASASAKYALKRYDEALADYNRALELKPDDPGILNNRGVTYDDLERYDEALADYNRALELKPDYAVALNNRGVTYRHLERYEDALADYNRALELNPDDPEILNNRGITYRYLGRYDEALADYNRALELNPDDPEILSNRGVMYRYLGRYEETFADLSHALQLKPDDPNSLYNMACLFSLMQKPEDAVAYLEKSIRLDETYRQKATTDSDFDNIRDDPCFRRLVEGI